MGGAKKGGIGLLLGVATGAVLGVLFAPKKGRDLRDNVKKEIQHGGTGLGTVGKNFAAMGKDMADTAHDIYDSPSVQNSLHTGGRKFSSVLKVLKAKITGGKKKSADK